MNDKLRIEDMIKGNQQTHIKSIDDEYRAKGQFHFFFFCKNIIRFSFFKYGVNYGKCTVQLKSECLQWCIVISVVFKYPINLLV